MILNRILNWINFERNSNIELNQFGYRTGLARREASLVCVWCQQCHKYIRESMSRRCTGSLCQCESSWPICHLMLLMSVLSHNWLFTVILKSCQWCQEWIKSLMSPDTAVSARAVGRLSSRGDVSDFKKYQIFDLSLMSLDSAAVSGRAVGQLSSGRSEAWPRQLAGRGGRHEDQEGRIAQ